jgi:hypothetical protein
MLSPTDGGGAGEGNLLAMAIHAPRPGRAQAARPLLQLAALPLIHTGPAIRRLRPRSRRRRRRRRAGSRGRRQRARRRQGGRGGCARCGHSRCLGHGSGRALAHIHARMRCPRAVVRAAGCRRWQHLIRGGEGGGEGGASWPAGLPGPQMCRRWRNAPHARFHLDANQATQRQANRRQPGTPPAGRPAGSAHQVPDASA